MTNHFKDTAIAYNEVAIALEKTLPHKPVSIATLYAQCPHAKNKQQVSDAVKKYRSEGKVGMLKEGRTGMFWWKSGAARLVAEGKIRQDLQQGVDTVAKKQSDRPEITVSDRLIVISTNKFKISIEI
jgi:hypothetical protein